MEAHDNLCECIEQPLGAIARTMQPATVALSLLFVLFSPASGGAQAAIPPVDFRPFADGRTWILKQPLIYRIGVSKDSVVIPVGFVTDMASIPPALQSIIQQNGPYQLPAVVHDYLYWRQECTRAQSDQILLLAMIEHRVSNTHRTAIYDAVRAAGQFAWADNGKERARNLLRIIPEDKLNIPALTYWPDYRTQLARDGAVNPTTILIPTKFCARGSMPIQQALHSP